MCETRANYLSPDFFVGSSSLALTRALITVIVPSSSHTGSHHLSLVTLQTPHPVLPLHAGSPELCHLNGDQIENESHQHGKDEQTNARGQDTNKTVDARIFSSVD